MTTLETVKAYYAAFERKDMKAVRELLAPDFKFKGPMMSCTGPEEFLSAMAAMPMEASFESSRLIAEGGRAANAYLFKMKSPAKAEIPMCDFFELKNGKIRSCELFFDARLFPGAPERP